MSATTTNTAQLRLDGWLLGSVVALLLLGLVMVFSSSIAIAEHTLHNSWDYFIRQLIFAIFSVAVGAFILYVPMIRWQKKAIWFLLIGFFLLLIVLVPGIGREVNGSRRWIHLGPIALQVSEAVKLCAVLYIADFLSRHRNHVTTSLLGALKPIVLLGAMGGLLLLEPDFGAVVVLFVMILGMMFMAGVQLRWFIILIILGAVAASGLVIISPYRIARFTGFLHPWDHMYGSGYQLTQSLMAFGRGGVFGVGLGNSLQKLFYLPEAHTDFLFAIMAEELGFIGVLVVLVLFLIMAWRGTRIARAAHLGHALFEAFLAYGITFWLSFQVVVNMGVNVGMLPTKGLTLPFMSYGGSSLVIDCVALAMLLRIDLENKMGGRHVR